MKTMRYKVRKNEGAKISLIISVANGIWLFQLQLNNSFFNGKEAFSMSKMYIPFHFWKVMLEKYLHSTNTCTDLLSASYVITKTSKHLKSINRRLENEITRHLCTYKSWRVTKRMKSLYSWGKMLTIHW